MSCDRFKYKTAFGTFLSTLALACVCCGNRLYALAPPPVETPTATPTPIATATAQACPGDCDGSGYVTVDELVLLVNIALEASPLSACPVGDGNGDGAITIDEILAAVNLAFAGCPGQLTPTPAPTSTPDGSFLCSAGPHDESPCNSDDDCKPGACVVAYGVCDGGTYDGFPCDCPGGMCVGTTCVGGPFAGLDCMTAAGDGNCGTESLCTSSARICLAGDYKAYPCLKDDDCMDDNGMSEVCGATAQFCDGGDFDGTSCVDNSDCTGADTKGCSGPQFDMTNTPSTTPTPTETPV